MAINDYQFLAYVIIRPFWSDDHRDEKLTATKRRWLRVYAIYLSIYHGGARGVMVIVAGIGHGDTSSNPGLIAFHIALIPLGKVWIQLFSLQL